MLLAAPAAAAQDAASAAAAHDISVLAELGREAGPDAALARALRAALLREEEEAQTGLRAVIADGRSSQAQRATANGALAGVMLRQGRFAEAVAAMEASGGADANEEQSLLFARALAAAPIMRVAAPASGEAAIVRDAAQLARAEARINGRTQEVVLDTGAGFSTVTQSTAERLGLRMLDNAITVGSVFAQANAARVAIGDELVFAGATFRDVVFIVLPDAALTFGDGAYRIEAILGLPVLVQLGRLEFARRGDSEMFRHSRSTLHPEPNLMLDGLRPFAIVEAAGVRMQMLLDTGARRSHIARAFADAHPTLIAGAAPRPVTVGGAGGARVHEDALNIPRLAFSIAGHSIELTDLRVFNDDGIRQAGSIGQDLMRAGSGYVIDFDAMRFEVLP
jgi:predicted aspartyl protease